MPSMIESLFDLERSLRSNKVNVMTLEEANIIMASKSDALRDFVIGTVATTVVSWFATRKVNAFNRLLIATGTSGGIGLWCFGRSLDSSVDRILSMEGKRIKDEMAKIVLMRYRDDPSVMQRVSKHFYSENVFDDFSLNRPKLRWRVRTNFSDPVALEKMRTHVADPNNGITSKEITTAAEKIQMTQKQAYTRTTVGSTVDPFDYVFGLPHQLNASSVPPAQGTHSQRRSRRRHRKRHQKVSEEEAMLA